MKPPVLLARSVERQSFRRFGFLDRFEGAPVAPVGFPEQQGLYDPAHRTRLLRVRLRRGHQGPNARTTSSPRRLEVLANLEHRGAAGAEKSTGDGAGILLQIPHDFFARRSGKLGFHLPARGHYGVGHGLSPARANRARQDMRCACSKRPSRRRARAARLARRADRQHRAAARRPRRASPSSARFHRARRRPSADDAAFERKLYVIRRLVEKKVSRSAFPGRDYFYVPSPLRKTDRL